MRAIIQNRIVTNANVHADGRPHTQVYFKSVGVDKAGPVLIKPVLTQKWVYVFVLVRFGKAMLKPHVA